MGFCSFPHKPILLRKTLTVFFCIVLFVTSLLSNVNFVMADSIITKNPTETWVITFGWNSPSYAYTSNDVRTTSAISSAKQGYRGYGFNIPSSATIINVEIGGEGYITPTTLVVNHAWTPNNGVDWYAVASISSDIEILQWTSTTWYSWLPSKLNDGNFSTRITHITGGGGCYGLDGEAGLWEGGLKLIRDIEIGDILTGWNFTHYVPATVLNATLHEGYWPLRRIICESIDRPNSFKDVLVTPDHVLPYFDLNKFEGDISKVKIKEDKAQDFKIRTEKEYGYGIFGFMEAKLEKDKVIPMHFQAYEVISNEELNTTEGVMDIVTDQKYFMGHYLLQRKEPTTGYVDSLPVRVTYSLPSVVCIPCLFIGICTLAGIFLLVLYLLTTEK